MSAEDLAEDPRRCSVLIAGGGIAGLETLLALQDLAEERVDITLLAREPEFTYRPMIVEEPFSRNPAERHDLALLARDLGASFVQGSLSEIKAQEHRAVLSDGSELGYDVAVVCVGAKTRPAYPSATTLRSWAEPIEIDEALDNAANHESRTLTFVVPPGIVWSLPLYELALLSRIRAEERRLSVEIEIITPESKPLGIFGPAAADAVAEILSLRRIKVRCDTSLIEREGEFLAMPGWKRVETGAVIALPLMSGPRISGLPADSDGFIPIDEFAEVPGVQDVFAAGDGTIFPIKQGGLGTQQADAAAEMIASRTGAPVDPQPFRPTLRGKLITGSESLNLTSEISGGGGEGVASPYYLWWPPKKVAGKYLAPFLDGVTTRFEALPPDGLLDVEVSVAQDWHSQPMALDPVDPVR